MSVWVFGYGSLVWRPAFPYARRVPAYIRGWQRRFWQGSIDHRGRPGAPGRVATLVRAEGAVCWGMAYRVCPDEETNVLAKLDHREKGGYERHRVTLHAGANQIPGGLMYLAGPDNPNYLGPARADEIAAQIQRAEGPSGPNLEYLVELERALVEMGAPDPHVSDLVSALRAGRKEAEQLLRSTRARRSEPG